MKVVRLLFALCFLSVAPSALAVQNNLGPIILVQPAYNAQVSGQVSLLATVSASQPPVATIWFYIDGNLLSSGTSLSTTWNSTGASIGRHAMQAIGEDANGNVLGSSTNGVTVIAVKATPTPNATSPEPTSTATPVATPTPMPTPVPSPIPTSIPTSIPTPVLTPTPAPTPTAVLVPTPTPTPVATASPTPSPTATPTPSPLASGSWGGLVTKWSWPISPTNLLDNGSFETGLEPWVFTPAAGDFWTQECTTAEDGSCALQILNGNLASGGSTFACQPLTQPVPAQIDGGAWYQAGGYVQTSGVTSTAGGGRYQLGDTGCSEVPGTDTDIIGGPTNPWTLTINAMTFLAAGDYTMVAYAYNKPNGTVQFDNVVVNQLESPTAEMFLLYPNYMAKLWDDGSQVLSADVRGAGTATAVLTDSNGNTLATTAPIALTPAWQTISLDTTSLALPDGVYTLTLNDPGANFTPQYQIVKEPRVSNGYIDEQGFLHLPNASGQLIKRFAIGVYDTGAAYGSVPAWTSYLSSFFPAVKADLYLNYFQDGTTQANEDAEGQALRSFGMAAIDTINDRMDSYNWFGIPLASYLASRATGDNDQPGLFAWYLADERDDEWSLGRGNPVQGTWGIRLGVRPGAPDMPALIVQNAPNELTPWRDVTDIIGIDPYSLYTSNPSSFVSTQTAVAITQGHNARPTWVVVQFFGNADGTEWPDQTRLREDTWQAICAGATGVFYWSLGAVGYQYLDTAALKTSHLTDLETVVNEVKSYETQLTGTPVTPPAFPTGIIGIARMVGTTTYVFSANTTAAIVNDSSGHTWQPYDTQFWSF